MNTISLALKGASNVLFAGLVYFVICFAASTLVKRLQKKYHPA